MIESQVSEAGGRRRGVVARGVAVVALLAGSAGMVGCTDSWLWDPSVVGRWEYTPTVVPILERIDVIERDRTEFVEVTQVMPEDLIPEVVDYQVGPGDVLNIEIFDLIQPNVPSPFQRSVDPRGFIDLPQIGRVHVIGLTSDQIRERLRQLLRELGIIEDALVSVQIAGQRAQTFSIFGAIGGAGRYFIAAPDYRLLEALTEAGGISPAIKRVYVIRQVPLGEEVRRGVGADDIPRAAPPDMRPDRPAEDRGRDLTDLIEELTTPGGSGGGASPGMLRASSAYRSPQQGGLTNQDEPPIDLVDEPTTARPVAPRDSMAAPAADPGRWMFLNGEWVRVTRRPAGAAAQGLPEGADPLADVTRAQDLVTQRVIEVPTDPLLQGVAEYNIVVRPGDVIRVPFPESGQFYLTGPGIIRGGAYTMPLDGSGITLTRAVASAGGLSGLAVPWRVDLTRKVATNQQATIRLNLKAIYEGTQPDVYLRPDDMLNFGTSFWATPLAVIRNGFRMSYGFGFLLDRNFGSDVFGAPPTNREGF